MILPLSTFVFRQRAKNTPTDFLIDRKNWDNIKSTNADFADMLREEG